VIDLHCHLLPAIDDGAADEAVALEMARIAVADGIRTIACTPHIYPGFYENDRAGIVARVAALQRRLDDEGIPLRLTFGADAHLTPELLGRIAARTAPTIADGRYLLVEPSHTVATPRFAEAVFEFVAAGYVPVITHPERLAWIETHYAMFAALVRGGVWMQVTAGSLVGHFGRTAQRMGERMLRDGLVHLLATDAHGVRHRAPRLAEGRRAAVRIVGEEEAERLVVSRPQAILDNRRPADIAPAPALRPGFAAPSRGIVGRLFGRG